MVTRKTAATVKHAHYVAGIPEQRRALAEVVIVTNASNNGVNESMWNVGSVLDEIVTPTVEFLASTWIEE